MEFNLTFEQGDGILINKIHTEKGVHYVKRKI